MADFDLAIIGGGINGTGIARDAAGRGLRVLLVEQNDLASGTSSASTKLIHGGLRYLERGALQLVHEALAEREVLWRMAPQIIRPLRFTLPPGGGMRSALCIRMGGQANVVSFPMSGAECRAAAVPATLSLARGIGQAVRDARAAQRDPLAALIDHLAGTHYGLARVLGGGKITDVARQFRGGWAIGTVTIAAFDGGSPFVLRVQNENLIVERDGAMLAIVPDLICLLDVDNATPVPTERLRYGQRVHILAIRAPEIMRTPAALRVFGPRAFGLDHDYRPLA